MTNAVLRRKAPAAALAPVLTALVTACALLVLAAPAAAHNVLIGSDPEEGASLDASPGNVTLTFDQTVREGDINEIAVTGPEGGQWVDQPPEIDGNEVSVPLGELGTAGEYIIGYRILSADGHPVAGEVPFTLTAEESGTPVGEDPDVRDTEGDTEGDTADDAGSDEQGEAAGDDGALPAVPTWAWLVAAGGLLAAGVALVLRLGRGSS
ncbi:copper resistance protein CopC [Haloechinothrix sp. LS1_15]|uniref:copper resistance CopC family protein n=1 Tax=Haloechinothrix sp. LS1_15 TaxID=2652248 RepID=UPI0029483196|nr:copper resistance protein CopC [Haloechinothrix sp. LS1_15]MDV6010885.1 copper resistance protein CopC [Haloechinothrix sp. LS1_15]